MKLKGKNAARKKSTGSKVLYAAAVVVGVIAIALLVDNIMLFKNNVAQYVAQGYPSSVVLKQLIPGQLLPGVFEPLALYLGIAFALWGLGIINQKVSDCLTTQPGNESCCNAAPEIIPEENKADKKDTPENETGTAEQVQESAGEGNEVK
ncbi:MAG TPA: hypothetical protein VHQ70_08070 [Syntrophomonadaceae bacterium]|nr:hypothetical protein [Syntrophomonadaceae bacterium]